MCLSRSEAECKCFIELRKIDWCIADMTAITERKSAMKKAADASHGARLRFWVFARIATVAEITEAYVSGELENCRVVVRQWVPYEASRLTIIPMKLFSLFRVSIHVLILLSGSVAMASMPR